jgi:NAD(P)-dependent dehydrogenase (short-subunit alcohol dehydrogenase family)
LKPAFKRNIIGKKEINEQKIAINAITIILSNELDWSNILINAMCPVWIHTKMGGRSAPRPADVGA